jgi:hypothetical protein
VCLTCRLRDCLMWLKHGVAEVQDHLLLNRRFSA